MKSQVRIAEFKNHFSRYLRFAQKGHEMIIKDRETPIARLVPFEGRLARLEVRPATGSLKDLDKLRRHTPENLTLQDLEQAIQEEKRERLEGVIEGLR